MTRSTVNQQLYRKPSPLITMPMPPAQIATSLEQLLTSHRTISGRSEPEFISLGNSLQTLYSETSRLSGAICTAVDLIGNPANGALISLRLLAQGCLGEFKSRRQAIGTSLHAVDTIFDKLTTLTSQTDSLAKMGLYLRVIGLNCGVECAHTPETRTAFSTMATEVVQLANTISQVATAFADDCQSMQHLQQNVRNGIAKDLHVLEGLPSHTEQAVAEAVSQVEQVTGKAMSALGDATNHTQSIASQVGEIVLKIQLHDSMSQRIDHIVQALTLVINTLQHTEDKSNSLEQQKNLAGAWRIVTLQCGQIKRIIEELDEAERHSRSAFIAIDQDVEAMGHCFACLSTGDNAATDQPQQNSLSFLQDSLSRLSRLMTDGATTIETLQHSTGQVSDLVSGLNRHMQSIEDIRFEIQLKALNAIIKAASLGHSGRTLDVLATETKAQALADRAHNFVKEVSTVHQTIEQSVGLLQAGDTLASDDAGRFQGEQLEQAITAITEALTRFDGDAERCANEAGVLHLAITKANDDLAFIARLSEELSSHHQTLSAIADSMAVWGQALDNHELNDDAIHLMQLYTTDQERQMHAAILGLDNEPEATSLAAEQGGDDADMFLFAAEDSPARKDDGLGDNIELF